MKSIITTLVLLLLINLLSATDRIVEESGAGGAYTTISAALTASANNDRIIIFPKASGHTFNESLSISRSGIKILSALQGQRFTVSGTVTFAGGAINSSLSGATILGNVLTTANNTHITGCWVQGTISNSTGPLVTPANMFCDNDSVYGQILMFKGRVSGCYIANTGVCISIPGATQILTDTILIVGNTINATISPSSGGGILIATTVQFVYVCNNLIYVENGNSSVSGYGINIVAAKTSLSSQNACYNNTVISKGTADLYYGMALTFSSGNYDVENNLVSTLSSVGYSISSTANGLIMFDYNYCNHGMFGTANPTNNTTAADTLSSDGHVIGGPAIDGGAPGTPFKDIDLSRNDAGCYGGSYSLANFNITDAGSRVLYMNSPRTVMVNQSFSINADGISK